ncbi:uncharacterized protein J3R85_017661 [Psidium guajava]|nr:uncharacterized protein J3R85_017661 [Psidium guajava]
MCTPCIKEPSQIVGTPHRPSHGKVLHRQTLTCGRTSTALTGKGQNWRTNPIKKRLDKPTIINSNFKQ